MTKNQIIEKLYLSKNLNDCIKKMEPVDLQEDLKSEVIAIVCEWPEEKIVDLHTKNQLEFYVVRVILNQIKSKTSPFYKKYRQSFAELTGEESHECTDLKEREVKELIQDIAIEEINNLYWYDAEILRMYLELGTFRAIQDKTGIPFISCYVNIKKSLKTLKRKATEEVNRPIFSKNELSFIQNNKACKDTRL
jgi:hypothetical protein